MIKINNKINSGNHNKSNFIYLSLSLMLILFFFTFFIPLTSAAVDNVQVSDNFKINSMINFYKPCVYNGTYCSSSTTCNFTIKNPNGLIISDNLIGSYNSSNGESNISINFDSLGIWNIKQTCCDVPSRGCGTQSYLIQITGSGFNDNLNFYIIILIISSGMVLLGILKRDAVVSIIGSFGFIILSLYSFINGIAGIRDVVYSRSISILVLGLAFYISIKAGAEIIDGY